MDKKPKQLMVPADDVLGFFWLKYGMCYVHPFVVALCLTLPFQIKHNIFWLFILCGVAYAGIRFASYHKRRFKEFNEAETLRAKEENRLPQHLYDQTAPLIFFWTCWIWWLIFMKISGVT